MTVLQAKKATVSAKRLEGKVALVTGGSRGIGAAIALKLAQEGATVAISYASNKKAADELVAEIGKLGGGALAFKANSGSESESQALVQEVVKAAGKIDILVNNAGVYAMAAADKITLDHYNHIFDVNVKGVIATTVAALPKLSDGGRIINVSSVAAHSTQSGFSVYSASKAAVDALTRIWARDLGGRHITVNGVAPGPVATEMYDSVPEEFKKSMIADTALGRVADPEDIADVVAFLASDEARWITGHTIETSGGIRV